MTDQTDLFFEQRGMVAHLRFSAPPHNHLNADLIERIADRLEALDVDPTCRAIILSSEGRIFCAGADFGAGEFDPRPFYVQAMRLYRTRKPMIAAVQGAAVGAGLGLAVAADFRVSCAEARFSANFNRLGFHPGFGMSVTLPRLIGLQMASLLLYTGRRIGGDEALRIGMVDELAAQDQVLDRAFALAEEIATSSPGAVQSTRETLRAGLADAVQTANARECELQLQQFKSEDFKEGVRAAAERRTPHFTGN
jgi:enoyl-CoA hydratase/carnithine racemase